MPRLADRAKVVTATTGTGTITLGAAVSGFQTFAAAGVLDGETLDYTIVAAGGAFEVGTGTYNSAGPTLTRGPTSSSNGGAAINLSGAAEVYVTVRAANIAQPQDLRFPVAIFGDGSDGDVTISSSVTLTRDMFYNNLTLVAGAALVTAGFRIFVRNTLDLSAAPAGAIRMNGSAGGNGGATGAQGVAGTRNSNGGTTVAYSTGNTGGAGGTAAGSPGGTSGATTASVGGGHPAGGAGGAGSGGAGGAGSTTANPSALNASFRRLFTEWVHNSGSAIGSFTFGRNSAGGGGGGDGTAGGGGGGSGGQGGCVAIYARIIARGSNITAAIIQAMGGAGGPGGTPAAGNRGGGGGGTGGAGGFVYLAYGELTGSPIANAIDVSGGEGGNGGNGSGTGIGGGGGGRGGRGRVNTVDVYNGSGTELLPDNGAAGTAASGATGGAGAAAVVSRVSL